MTSPILFRVFAEVDAFTDRERVQLLERLHADLGADGLSRAAAAWWRELELVASVSPELACDLVAVHAEHCKMFAARTQEPRKRADDWRGTGPGRSP